MHMQTDTRSLKLTDIELRRHVHTAGFLAATIPPFVGGTVMGLIGFYPLPEFYEVFLQWNVLLYIGVAIVISQLWSNRLTEFLLHLPTLNSAAAAQLARKRLKYLPWALIGAVTLYSMGGVIQADLGLEAISIQQYSAMDHVRNELGMIPIGLITIFPIYLYLLDRIGRYVGPRGIAVAASPLWVKAVMLGVVTPLVIDSVLVNYYVNRTGVFDETTALLWLSLFTIAIGGTALAWRSLRQGLIPLEAFAASSSSPSIEKVRQALMPLSLDELGVLTARYAEMLEKQEKIEEQLRRNESWLRHTQAIANVGSWEFDPSTDQLRWSEETSRIFGRLPDRSNKTYATFRDAVHPEDREAVDRAYQISVENHTPYRITHRIVRPDGEIRWVQERGETTYDANNRALRTTGAVQDITERVRDEQALRTSNQMVSAVLNTTPVLIAYLDPDMNFIRVNSAYAAADGKDPDFFTGKNHFALYPNAENEAIFRRVATTGEPHVASAKPFEYEHNPERGISHWDWTLTPIKNSRGAVEGLVLSLLNVTDRVKALEAARTSERKLLQFNEDLEKRVEERTTALRDAMELNNQILGASEVGIGVYRVDGQCVFVNDAMANITGGTRESLLAQNFRQLQSWKARGIDELAIDALETGKPQGTEFCSVTSFGRDIWANMHFVPFERADGRHLLLMVTDISERKNADSALARNAQRLETAQQIARIGDYELDIDTGELFWSRTAHELLGYQQGTMTPTPQALFDRIHPGDVAMMQSALHRALTVTTMTGPYPIAPLPSIDYRVVLPDGTLRWIHTQAHISFDEKQKALKLVGTIQDITERKHAEAALIEARDIAELANSAKSDFLSRMSHELRTPMNAILGFAQILELEQISPEQHDFVLEIHRAGDHLLELINELLDLSRIEAGKLTTVAQATNLSLVVRQTIQLTQSAINARHIVLTNECSDARHVLADPTRLKQILVNLLSNATKYNREGGRITIRCSDGAEGRLRLSVTDTGEGIPPEKLGSLFKPFERLGAEFSAVEGTGIGLALSKQLAELMRGTIGVDSVPGQGSTFWFELPQAEAELEIPHTDGTKHAARNTPDTRRKVLYIEDNSANLRVVEALFRHQPQLQLLSATNGEHGLELAKRYHPDSILLDIHLPGMDGYAVLEELKKDPLTKNIPVIALSADAMPIDIEKGLKAGFARYLTKPIKADELVEALSRERDFV